MSKVEKYFKYKNYRSSCKICLGFPELFGKILFISDVITYAGNSITELENEFRFAVDDYLETCKALGKSPAQSLTGDFDIHHT